MGVSLLLVSLLIVALLVIPGATIVLASGLRVGWSLAAGPAITFGLLGLTGWLYGGLNLPFTVASAAAAWFVMVVLALGWRFAFAKLSGRVSRKESPTDLSAAVPTDSGAKWASISVPALGIAVATIAMSWMGFAEILKLPHGLESVVQSWDVHWHASVIRSALNDGIVSSTRMGDIQNVETHATTYYPAAWHALGTLVVAISGQTVPATINFMGVVPAAFLTPLGAAAFAWRMVDLPGLKAPIAAGIAAVITSAVGVLVPIGISVGAWPYQLAIALVGVTFALLTSLPNRPIAIFASVLALVGIGTLHPSAVPTTVLLGLIWWICYRLWRPVNGRIRDIVTIVLALIPAAALLVPQWIVGGSQSSDIRSTTAEVEGLDRSGSIYRGLTMLTRHAEDAGAIWPVLIMGFAGLVLMLFAKKDNRRLWPLVAWAVSVVFTIHGMNHFGNAFGNAINVYTELHYSTPHRLVQTTAFLLSAAGGVAVATVIMWVSGTWREEKSLINAPDTELATNGATEPYRGEKGRRREAIALGLAVVVTAAVIPYAVHRMAPFNDQAYKVQRVQPIIGEADLQAFDWLEAQPETKEHRVFTNPAEGSAWMFPRNNIDTVFRHFDWPVADEHTATSMLYWHADLLGVGNPEDPNGPNDVDQAVDKLNVGFIYISPPNIWESQKRNEKLLTFLWWARGVTPVYKDREVTIYAVNSKIPRKAIDRMRAQSPEPIPPTFTRGWADGRNGSRVG